MRRCSVPVFALLLISAACSVSGPSAPSVTNPPVTNSRLSGPLRAFSFASQIAYPVSHSTQQSSVRLYDNGAFALDYSSGSYVGSYTERDGSVVFEWEAGSMGGAWGATGKLSGETLAIRYNAVMQLSDFEDAIYLRVR